MSYKRSHRRCHKYDYYEDCDKENLLCKCNEEEEVFIIENAPGFPPWSDNEYVDGIPSGISIDMMILIAKEAGSSHYNKGDFLKHFSMAKGTCTVDYWDTSDSCLGYPPLFKTIASIFTFNERTFYIFSLLILTLIIPITLKSYNK